MPVLFFYAALAAGDIFRCTGSDGTVVFQDNPCSRGGGQVLRSDRSGNISNERLRQWLEEARPSSATEPARQPLPRSPVRSTSSYSETQLPARPVSEIALAQCSQLFLDCTAGGRMDACIADLPRCSRSAGTCCADPFIDRYQTLRTAGATQRDAVRQALLGDR